MAKSKSFFGLRRGSTKSLTFQVLDGKQITKDRVSEVKNPRTNGQMIQRAVTATIMMAYSAGKSIFDHSFEGKQVPAGSQREFLSVNMHQLREDYAADLKGNVAAASCVAAFVAPKATRPVPYSFIVSKGTLDMKIFNVVAGTGANDVAVQLVQAASGTVGEWAQANHVVPGDIYTIVALGAFNGTSDYQNQPKTSFGFIRLKVLPNITENTQAFATATLADLFSIDESGEATPIPGSTLVSVAINIDQVVSSCSSGAIGVIRSRENSGQRSECRLMCRPALDSTPYAPWTGIKTPYLLDWWSAAAVRVGDSNLILEGGNF